MPPDIILDHERGIARLATVPDRSPRGARSSVSDELAARARYDYWYMGVPQTVLAERLGKTQGWVSQLVNFRILRHVG